MRNDTADGLKALALLGVFLVNGLGYALAPPYPIQLGAPLPVDSHLAQTVHALVLTLLMGKALPFLAFLFGYSMANFVRKTDVKNALKHRQYKLLLIGFAHGTFVYFGDILTSYALLGLLLGGSIALRGRLLLKRWKWWASVSALIVLSWLIWEWQVYESPIGMDSQSSAMTQLTFIGTSTYPRFWELNAHAYLWNVVGWTLFSAPLHACLFITGILAARCQWLSLRPRLPHLFLRPWLMKSWPLALLSNALLGVASIHMHNRYGLLTNVYWISLLNIPLGVWLVASAVTRFMLHLQTQQTKQTKQMIPRWLAWLAPAGRHTLAMYLGLSLVLMLCGRLGLFSAEAAWNHTAVWALGLLGFWLMAVCLGRLATKKGMRDPFSRWLSR